MSDRIMDLKAKIDRELRFIRFCKLNGLSSDRAYERLAGMENELYIRRKLSLERRQDDLRRKL